MAEKIEVYYRATMEPSIMFPFDTNYEIHLSEFEVLKHTPCGVWIKYWSCKGKKFILTGCKKQYAYATPEEAKKALGYRLRFYVRILQNKLSAAQEELDAYDCIMENK